MNPNALNETEQEVTEIPGTETEAETATDAPAAPDTADLESLHQELAATKDQLLRQMADFQNFRRRKDRESEQSLLLGQTQVLLPMLDVLDDFGRALEAAEQAEAAQDEAATPAYESLRQGVEMVYQKFLDALRRLGVEPMEAVGQPFDEHRHEALLQQPAPEGTTPGTILAEVQKGYRMGDRVLRHARVIVAA